MADQRSVGVLGFGSQDYSNLVEENGMIVHTYIGSPQIEKNSSMNRTLRTTR